jgi:hypothetical protein
MSRLRAVMAAVRGVLWCAVTGLALWSVVGYVIALRLPMPAHLRAGLAPALGWAVQTSVSLMLSLLFGFSVPSILASVLIAFGALLCAPPVLVAEPRAPLPAWIFAGAAILALMPAAAILPKIHSGPRRSVRSDVRSFEDSADRSDRSRGYATRQPGDWWRAPARRCLLLPVALWSRRTCTTNRGKRLGGRRSFDVVHCVFLCVCHVCVAAHLARRALAPVFVLIACTTASIRPNAGGALRTRSR